MRLVIWRLRHTPRGDGCVVLIMTCLARKHLSVQWKKRRLQSIIFYSLSAAVRTCFGVPFSLFFSSFQSERCCQGVACSHTAVFTDSLATASDHEGIASAQSRISRRRNTLS